MDFTRAIILAVVEGLTEYLPISSTGHIILTSWLMGINQQPFVKDFTVMVQFGAIFAVVVLYWRRFLLNTKIYPQVFLAFLPAAVIGLAVKKHIDLILGSVWIVAVSLVVGGVLLILTDHWLRRQKATVANVESLPPVSAIKVGIFQTLAFVPGVSRAAATIWGGLYEGMDLKTATEFSFFLAVPTLTGASALKLIKAWPELTPENIQFLVYGNIVSFIVGLIAIRFFVHWVQRSGLRIFGIYRIVLGLIVIAVLLSGQELQVL